MQDKVYLNEKRGKNETSYDSFIMQFEINYAIHTIWGLHILCDAHERSFWVKKFLFVTINLVYHLLKNVFLVIFTEILLLFQTLKFLGNCFPEYCRMLPLITSKLVNVTR